VRVVIDPNVLVSAAVSHGVSAQLFDRWTLERPFELVVCAMLLDELDDVLRRDRFRSSLSLYEVGALIQLLREHATHAPDPEDIPAVTGDPDDDYLVALAREQDADYLVSGDPDLKGLTDPEPPVLSPAALLEILTN
jgi:uncharacterized protein